MPLIKPHSVLHYCAVRTHNPPFHPIPKQYLLSPNRPPTSSLFQYLSTTTVSKYFVKETPHRVGFENAELLTCRRRFSTNCRRPSSPSTARRVGGEIDCRSGDRKLDRRCYFTCAGGRLNDGETKQKCSIQTNLLLSLKKSIRFAGGTASTPTRAFIAKTTTAGTLRKNRRFLTTALVLTGGTSIVYLVLPSIRNVFAESSASDEEEEETEPLYSSLLSDLEDDWDADDEEWLLFSHTSKRPGTFIGEVRYLLTRYVLEPILVVARVAVLFFLFAPVILSAPAVFVGSRVEASGNERSGALWWFHLLVTQMERAGPTFVKLAQWAASRADVFPPQLCRILSKLHSSVKPHSYRHTVKSIEKAFDGRRMDDLFEKFDEEPIGVGAIAQVYRATFKPEILEDPDLFPDRTEPLPKVVAIKVLHPRTASLIRRDLIILSFGAKLLSILPDAYWLSLPEEVEVFGKMMMKQLDLRIEGTNLRVFQNHFRHRNAVSFPTPVRAYRSVLVEEYMDALPIGYFLHADGTVYDKSIAGIGLDAFLHMLILDNFVHADLHPGNILIRFHHANAYGLWERLMGILRGNPIFVSSEITKSVLPAVLDRKRFLTDAVGWTQDLDALYRDGWDPQVVFIDTGLTATLNRKNRRDFLDLFRAIAEFDGYRAGTLMIERCRAPHLALNGQVFAREIEEIVRSIKDRTFALAKVSISDVLTRVMTLVREHHVKLEGDFVNIVLSVLLLEGIGRRLDPDLDLFKVSLPILRDLSTTDGFKQTLKEVKQLPIGGGMLLKTWLWLEARDWVKVTYEDVIAEITGPQFVLVSI